MLQYSTIEPGTLDVLGRLMALPGLNNFYLAGGTALALYYGHRISVDIDLFSTDDFDGELLGQALENAFPTIGYSNPHNVVGLFSFIENVKVDFVRHHRFPMIDDIVTTDGVRLAGTREIMAMKVAAIMKRGVKKDFWDIAELLNNFPVPAMIDAYNLKYPSQQFLISVPQAMTYFSDAEESEDPVSLKGQTWASVKDAIQQKVNAYLR